MLTQEDYKKIQQWLTKNSVKDTEFNESTMPFKGNEIITIIQDNQNKKVFLKDLVAQIFNLGVSDFINVSEKYDAYIIDLEEAIRLIPSRARKKGQVITFLNKENLWQIYQFKGTLNQWNVLGQWEDLFANVIIDPILPDEEDLTKSLPDENGNSYLSLKDREYNPEDFSGLGKVILRKNIVEIEDPIYGKVKKNVLYQDMINKENTIYEIRYDFDLNGEEIVVPEGCMLKFEGGSLSNGTINYNNTIIEGYERLNMINITGEYIRLRDIDPDEEDITKEGGVLKFKNRDTSRGMGYIILRKDKSFAEQVTKENTIYEIRYDFILNENATIPANCVLKFNGGSISGSTTIDLNYCSCVGNISFKGIKINNFNGGITAKQLGLSQGDNIADVIGTGWKDCDVDLENIALVQRVNYIQFSGNYCHIIRWNINRINSKATEPTSSNLAEARLVFSKIPNLVIEYCTFDGTGSNVNFVGGNFYFSFTGINILNCPNAIVRYNTIKNFPASCGIFAEVSDNIRIIDNIIKNCSIYVTPVNDTNGDGIYVRTTKNAIIKNNIVDIDDNIQIGRCGICHEHHTSGIIENNTISGYDRGIHIEYCYDYNTVRNNHITRCHSAIMIWSNSDYANTGNIAHIIVENNYLSNKGMVKSSINNKNYTPLKYERAIIDLKNAASSSFNENKNTEFINNIIESFDTGDYNNYLTIQTDYSGEIIKNKFIRKGTHIPALKLVHFNQNYDNHFYFVENEFEGYFYVTSCPYITINNNIIKQLQVSFLTIKPFDITHDYTTQISIQNNIYQMLAESKYEGGAVAIFSQFGGIFKNNVWGLGTAHYSMFNEKNIAKGTIIDNNVFQLTHSYEGNSKTIWYGRSASDVSPNLTPGKNLLVDLRDGSNAAIIDNPQYSA